MVTLFQSQALRSASIALALSIAAPFSACAQSQIKVVNWGAEAWRPGLNDFIIQLREKGTIRILGVTGYITAAPQVTDQPESPLLRQTLASMVILGRPHNAPATVVQTPPSANHSVDAHLFSVNVKQMGQETKDLALNYTFPQKPVAPEGKLLLRIENASYRARNGHQENAPDANDALDTELQLNITYEVDP